jgi:hypothetical protein
VYPSVIESVAPLMVNDMAYIALLSTYMVRSLRVHVLVISSRLVVYIADNIGDKGEPCGVPLMISKESKVCPPPLSMAVLADRKDSIQAHMPRGKPLSQKICTVWAGLTLSKKPEMSKSNRAPVCFAAVANAVRDIEHYKF